MQNILHSIAAPKVLILTISSTANYEHLDDIWHLNFYEQDIAWIMTINTNADSMSDWKLSKNHNILPLQVNYGLLVVSTLQWYHINFIIIDLCNRNPQDSSKYFAQRVSRAGRFFWKQIYMQHTF